MELSDRAQALFAEVNGWAIPDRERNMETETPLDYEKIKNERDCLLKIVEGAQRREAEAERTIQLLIIAGHVKEDRVAQARELAK